MVKLQCSHTSIIAAFLTTRALVCQRLLSDDFPAPADGLDQIAATIPRMSVALPPVSSLLQPAALPTELPGNVVQLKRTHCSISDEDEGEGFLWKNERKIACLHVEVFGFVFVGRGVSIACCDGCVVLRPGQIEISTVAHGISSLDECLR